MLIVASDHFHQYFHNNMPQFLIRRMKPYQGTFYNEMRELDLPRIEMAAAVTGAGYGSNPPVAMQLLGEHGAESHRGLVMGLRAASSRLAQVLQPIVFGSLAAAAGTALAFPISGGALAVMALWRRRDLRALGGSRPPPDS